MAAYIVTYDLNKESTRPPLLDDIKDTYSWARLSESSYAISTNQTANQVYDHLRKHIDDNDNLFVINLRKPYQGWGPQDVHDWLNKNLPE